MYRISALAATSSIHPALYAVSVRTVGISPRTSSSTVCYLPAVASCPPHGHSPLQGKHFTFGLSALPPSAVLFFRSGIPHHRGSARTFTAVHISRRSYKETALGFETLGGRAMQGLVTPLELVVVPYLRLVWAYQREARRRRAARPARASRERVAVVGSGTRAVMFALTKSACVQLPALVTVGAVM